VYPGAQPRLRRSTTPRTRAHDLKADKAFEADDGAKWTKAVAKIAEHIDVLLAAGSLGQLRQCSHQMSQIRL
jgi:hypothetical protein